MRTKLRCWLAFLAIVCGISQAESFYQTYSGASNLTITNLGANPVMISSVLVRNIPLSATNLVLKRNGVVLYDTALNSNTVCMLIKSDLAGLWFKNGDTFSVETPTNALVTIDSEESR